MHYICAYTYIEYNYDTVRSTESRRRTQKRTSCPFQFGPGLRGLREGSGRKKEERKRPVRGESNAKMYRTRNNRILKGSGLKSYIGRGRWL